MVGIFVLGSRRWSGFLVFSFGLLFSIGYFLSKWVWGFFVVVVLDFEDLFGVYGDFIVDDLEEFDIFVL